MVEYDPEKIHELFNKLQLLCHQYTAAEAVSALANLAGAYIVENAEDKSQFKKFTNDFVRQIEYSIKANTDNTLQ